MTPPAATAAGRALPRPVAPRAPRRVSGPARARSTGAPARTRAQPRTTGDPLVLRALRVGRGLADSRFLDRLVAGRLWIPIVAAGLMGIVFMQVSMLKMNAGIGRAVQSSNTLERQNTGLRADVSRMEAGSRIATVAHDIGMVVPADGSGRYVQAGHGAAALAARRMTAPSSDALIRAQGHSAPSDTTPGAAGPTAATATPATQQAAAPAAAATTQPVAAPAATTQQPTQQAAAPVTQQPVQPAPATQQPAAATQQPAAAPTAAPVTATATAAGGTAAPAGEQG